MQKFLPRQRTQAEFTSVDTRGDFFGKTVGGFTKDIQLSPGNPTNTVVSEYASLGGISPTPRLSRSNRLLLDIPLRGRWWVESCCFFNVMFGLYVLGEEKIA